MRYLLAFVLPATFVLALCLSNQFTPNQARVDKLVADAETTIAKYKSPQPKPAVFPALALFGTGDGNRVILSGRKGTATHLDDKTCKVWWDKALALLKR